MRDGVISLLVAAALGSGPAMAGPSLEVLHADWLQRRDAVMAQYGLDPDLPPARVGTAPESVSTNRAAVIDSSNVRLALAQLAMSSGTGPRPDLSAALTAGDGQAIYLRGGAIDLAGLEAAIAGTALHDALRRDGNRLTLHRPVIVMQGAALRLSPGEALYLSREDGAFLAVFGTFEAEAARIGISSMQDSEESAQSFRPFIAAAGTGSLDLRDSDVTGLGYGPAAITSGLAIATGGLYRPERASHIEGNRLTDLHGVSVDGSARLSVTDNRVEASRGVALRLSRGDDTVLRDNLVLGSAGEYALRVAGPSRGAEITGNVLLQGRHGAVRIDDDASELFVAGNVMTGFRGTALTIDEGVDCLRLSGNLIAENGGSAISLTNSGALVLDANAILDNGGTGIALSAQRPETAVLVLDNVIAGNRSGIRTAMTADLRVARNDLTDQLPRLLSGEMAQHLPLYLKQLRDTGTVDLSIDGVDARRSDPLRRDAAAHAFDTCSQGEAS